LKTRRAWIALPLLLVVGFAAGWAFGALRDSDERPGAPTPRLLQQQRLSEQNRELEREREALRAEGVENRLAP
jgi:alkylated DNA nucleotide flippase Atl1